MVSPSVPTGKWMSTSRPRTSYSWLKTGVTVPAASISQTSMPKRTKKRLDERTNAPLLSLRNRILPVSRSRSLTRQLPSVRLGRTTRAP